MKNSKFLVVTVLIISVLLVLSSCSAAKDLINALNKNDNTEQSGTNADVETPVKPNNSDVGQTEVVDNTSNENANENTNDVTTDNTQSSDSSNTENTETTENTNSTDGLEVLELNPFDYVKIEYEGISGYDSKINPHFEWKRGEDETLDNILDKLSESLKIDQIDDRHKYRLGETFTLKVDEPEDYYMNWLKSFKNTELVLTENSKDYVADGFSKFVQSVDEIPERYFKVFESSSLDEIANAYNTSTFGNTDYYLGNTDYARGSGYEYIGAYVLNDKSNESNLVYLMFKNDFTYLEDENGFKTGDTETVYVGVCFDDVILETDGSLTADYSGNVITRFESKHMPASHAYRSLEDFYIKVILEKEGKYNITATDGMYVLE
ncbi:MAG: hypothetical protein IJ593_04990 [Lachnospiraceae bacterium]|nr:hypothetical protein [Lachnospiraceae bacterium]